MAELNEQKVKNIIQQELRQSDSKNRFTLTPIQSHNHTGTDSPPISFQNLTEIQFTVSSVIPGTSAATAGNYGQFFIAPFQCSIQEIQQAHTVNGSDGGTVKLFLEVLKLGQVSGSGIPIISFNMKIGANLVATSSLRRGSVAYILQPKDRLSLFMDGTPTDIAQVVVTVLLQIN